MCSDRCAVERNNFCGCCEDLHLTKFRWLTQIIDFIIDSSTLLELG